jgi:hypothetical protein
MAKQLSAGEIVIDKLQCEGALGSFSLVTHLEELNIYEDIFSNTLKGHLTLQDAYNLPQYLPFSGEETIVARIALQGVLSDVDGKYILAPPKFHVHDLSDRFLKTPKAQRYSLDLVSEQYMSNVHSKVSKSYADWNTSDIVEDIWALYLDDGKDLQIEETAKNDHIIIPNWHPHDAFNWLATRSAPAEDTSIHNYLYFESLAGSNFLSMNSLMKVEPVFTFGLEQRIDDPSKVEGLSGGFVKVDKITYDGQFHKIKNIKRGMYSSKLVTHDIVTKQIAQHDFNGFDEWFYYKHLGDYFPLSNSETEIQAGLQNRKSLAPPFSVHKAITEGRQTSEYTDSRVDFYPKHDKMYATSSIHEYDNNVESWLQHRNQQMQLFDGVTMQVECAGVSFIRIGMVITLQVPSPETTSTGKREVAFDTILSGKYMITAIKHVITQQAQGNFGYKMLVELSKDGISRPLPYRDPYKNPRPEMKNVR